MIIFVWVSSVCKLDSFEQVQNSFSWFILRCKWTFYAIFTLFKFQFKTRACYSKNPSQLSWCFANMFWGCILMLIKANCILRNYHKQESCTAQTVHVCQQYSTTATARYQDFYNNYGHFSSQKIYVYVETGFSMVDRFYQKRSYSLYPCNKPLCGPKDQDTHSLQWDLQKRLNPIIIILYDKRLFRCPA